MTTWYPEGYGYNQKYYYPPGPPALSAATSNRSPPTWRGYQRNYNSDSGKTSSGRRASVQLAVGGRSNKSSYPQHDLVDGVDYFKIGDTVRIRRWNADTDSFTDWVTGQVVRPLLVENPDGTQKRTYLCSYEHGQNQERKEREFSPHYREIANLGVDPVVSGPIPLFGNGGRLVFAPIPVRDSFGNKRVVYSPALMLTAPNERGGVRLRILAGPAIKREIDSFPIQQATPYNTESAQILRQKGFRVEGDGISRVF